MARDGIQNVGGSRQVFMFERPKQRIIVITSLQEVLPRHWFKLCCVISMHVFPCALCAKQTIDERELVPLPVTGAVRT